MAKEVKVKITRIYVENFHGNGSKEAVFAGPVRFTCNGDIDSLMVEHSIWEPRKLFRERIPFGGKVTISSELEF